MVKRHSIYAIAALLLVSGTTANALVTDNQDRIPVIVLLKEDFKGLTDITLSNKRVYSSINALSGEVSSQILTSLENDPRIDAVFLDKTLRISLEDEIKMINANVAWNLLNGSLKGSGQTVCIIDTGVDYGHETLGNCITEEFLGGNCSKVLGGYNFVDDNTNPIDDNGHGTHVAGIVASNDGLHEGVAPDANVAALKVCDKGGVCYASDIVAGVDWCVGNKESYNISAITLSIGDGGQYNSSTCPKYLDLILNVADSYGILVIAPSGNQHYENGISYPACSPYVLSAGAITKNDAISGFTNTGDLLDILAPGERVYSPKMGGGFSSVSGTSIAVPFVAGASLLLKQYNSTLSTAELKDVLTSSNISIHDPESNLSFPRLDVPKSFESIGVNITESEDDYSLIGIMLNAGWNLISFPLSS